MCISSRLWCAVVCGSVFLAACGGGGGGAGGDPLPGKQITYAVGGTLILNGVPSGQSAPSITLVDAKGNGTVTLKVAGPFEFAALAAGVNYQLEVSPLPVGYGCQVRNGDGTVPNAAVNNITVTCNANTYSLGGTVSGLGANNGGLQLSNGSDVISIAGDGPFTFSPVTLGANYSITTSMSPGFSYGCVVTNGIGTNVTANITNIRITCAASVHVTVSGLGAANSIQLTNAYTLPDSTKGSDALAVNGSQNGLLQTFATPLPSGSHYLVTVSMPDPNFNCNVSVGELVVGASAINVGVTCVERTYSIGGTVSGLGSTNTVGLTDTVNNTSTSVTGAGATPVNFTIGSPRKTATNYNITITSPPAGFVCSINNGSGTVNAASVTTIAISCVPQLTISNVSPNDAATGVARTVNPQIRFSATLNAATVSTNSVSLSSVIGNVGITPSVTGNQITIVPMSSKLLPLNTYRLNVGSQIRGSNNDTLLAPFSSTFTTADGAWQAPLLINAPAGGVGARDPQIAFDASGNAIVVWWQADVTPNNTKHIWSNRRAANGVWGVATKIENGTSDAYGPQIAFDSSGNALVVWDQGGAIWSNRYSAGAWGAATLIGRASGSGNPANPQIAVDSNGNALVVGAWYDGTPNILLVTYTGGVWGLPKQINTYDAFYGPQLAMNASGQALITWGQFDVTHTTITTWYAPYVGGVVGAASQISGQVGNPAQVAIDATGDAFAVWSQPGGVFSRRYSSGAWSVATRISNGIGSVQYPQIAMDTAGNAMAVWTGAGGAWANRYSVGSWGAPALVSNDLSTNDGAPFPQLAIDARGNAMAVWWSQLNNNSAISMNRYRAKDGAWGAVTQISNSFTSPPLDIFPKLAVDANGSALAVWYQYDNGSLTSTIYSNRFE